jgi:hypothetical protein
MPTRSLLRPAGLAVACAAALLIIVPSVAGAKTKTVPADLRVVGPSGQSLAQLQQYTGSVKVPTDPGAECFGQGTGGSGNPVRLVGPNALGIVQDASKTARDVKPLSITDAFDFGLGVCGIGGFQAQGSASWYLKHDHTGAQISGEQIPLSKGDDVLWYLAPSFPYPPELALEAPDRVGAGPIPVEVSQYADDGTRTPAAGVSVTGGSAIATSDSQGLANVPVSGQGGVTLRATRGVDIPAEEVPVCVGSPGPCGDPVGPVIAGTAKPDRMKGTGGSNKIKALASNDRVNARGGGADRVNCGSGRRDVALVDRTDAVRACEKVKRK